MASEITRFIKAMVAAKGSVVGLQVVLEAFNINPVILALSALVATIGLIKYATGKSAREQKRLNEEFEQSTKEMKDANSAYESAQSALEGLQSQLKEIQKKIKEINSEPLTVANEQQLNNLKEQEASLKRQVQLQQQKVDLAQQEAITEAKKTLDAKEYAGGNIEDALANLGTIKYSASGEITEGGYSYDSGGAMTEQQALKDIISLYQALDNEKQDLINTNNAMLDSNGQLIDSSEATANQFSANEQRIKDIETAQTSLSEQGYTLADSLNTASTALSYGNELDQQTSQSVLQLVDSFLQLQNVSQENVGSNKQQDETLQNLKDSYGELADEVYDYMQEHDVSEEEAYNAVLEQQKQDVQEVADAYKDAISSVGSLGDSYDQLASAVNEYNSSGSLSFETLSKLLSMGSEYLSLLQFENGQMSINEAGFQNLANAMIDDAEAKAISSAEAQILANANNTAGDSASNLGSQASGAVSGLNSANQAIVNLAISAENGAYKVNALYKALGGTGNVSVQKQEVVKSLASQINALESARKSIGSYTKATGKSSKATGGSTKSVNKNTEALKKQKEALDDIVKEYEKVISYIKSKVKDYVDELEDARDAEVDALDDQIDKLDELKDAEIDAIELEIDALKEKQNAEEKYWQDKIDALKAQNDAIQDQIDLQKLLDNLEQAKAKKVKVYREGKGFVYETDTTEVSKAQQELDDYLRKKSYEDKLKELEDYRDKANDNYEKQLDDLDKYKDSVKNNYDNQISNLKAQQDQIKKTYQEQIDYYNNWLKQFEKGINAYETEQNRLKALELTGIDFENDAWKKRNKDAQGNYTSALNDLKGFVDKYYEYQKQLATITEQINKSTSSATSGGGGGGGGGGISISTPTVTTPTKPYTVFEILGSYNTSTQASTAAGKAVQSASSADKSKIGAMSYGGKYVVYKKLTQYQYDASTKASNQASSLVSQSQGKKKYGFKQFAKGTYGVGEDSIALVGENPNSQELAIGSKLNGGTIMPLKQGTGIIPHNLTSTLVSMAQMFNSGIHNLQPNTTNNDNGLYIDKVVIEGANITDVVSFKNSLMNLKSEATQRAYRHR